MKGRKVLRAEPADDVDFAGLKPNNLGILARNEQEGDSVEIGKPSILPVRLPVVGIPLESDSLAGHILLNSKRPQACDLVRRCRQAPSLGDLAILIRLFEKMARDDGDAIK